MDENVCRYTLDDIAQFLEDYKQSEIIKPKEWMVGIPLVGSKLYERLVLEHRKREVFLKAYQKVVNGSRNEQIEFIKKMTPILDDYYGMKENQKMKR